MTHTREQWRARARALIERQLDGPWELGDWLATALERGWNEDVAQVLNADPRWEPSELAQYAVVSQQIEPFRRRQLPWSYHEAVARLPADDQDELLDIAETEDLTVSELRKLARARGKDISP